VGDAASVVLLEREATRRRGTLVKPRARKEALKAVKNANHGKNGKDN
jgi:hypothetical protein